MPMGKIATRKIPNFCSLWYLKIFVYETCFHDRLSGKKKKIRARLIKFLEWWMVLPWLKRKQKKNVTNKRSEQFGFDPNQSRIRVRIPFLNVAEANWTQPSPSPSPSWSSPIIKGLLCNIYGANSVRIEGGRVHLQSEFLNLIAYISDSESCCCKTKKKCPIVH